MNFRPELIGVGKYVGELADWLARQGHAVDVVAAQPHYPGFIAKRARAWFYSRGEEDGVGVTRCPLLLRRGGRGLWRTIAPLSFGLTVLPAIVVRALRFQPDVVLCLEPTLFAAPASILAARLVGARLALHVQDLEIDAAFATDHLKSPALRYIAGWCEAFLLRRFDAVATISDGMAARLRAKMGGPADITVLRNWIWQAGPPKTEACCAMRRCIGIGPGERMLLYAGHLGAKQDIPTLIAALRLVREHRADLRVVIAGDGPLAEDIAAARAFLPGLILLPLQSCDDLAVLLAAADAHVLPQDARAADLVFPSKLGPMLATGRPVVVTANPGSDLAVWLGDAAWLVPAGAPQTLAAAIVRVIDEDPVERSARARALSRTLDATLVLPAFRAFLTGLAAGSRPVAVDWVSSRSEPATPGRT